MQLHLTGGAMYVNVNTCMLKKCNINYGQFAVAAEVMHGHAAGLVSTRHTL